MRSLKKLWTDNRGIEGLPIRLVIALVVGVASLAIMTTILGGLPTFEQTEVTVSFDRDSSGEATAKGVASSSKTVKFAVVTDEGEPVQGARVVFTSGSVGMSGSSYVTQPSSGDNSNQGSVTVSDEAASNSPDIETQLRNDQETGTIKVNVKPPSDSDYVDDNDNPSILVTR